MPTSEYLNRVIARDGKPVCLSNECKRVPADPRGRNTIIAGWAYGAFAAFVHSVVRHLLQLELLSKYLLPLCCLSSWAAFDYRGFLSDSASS